jgi:hypothetical protein
MMHEKDLYKCEAYLRRANKFQDVIGLVPEEDATN